MNFVQYQTTLGSVRDSGAGVRGDKSSNDVGLSVGHSLPSQNSSSSSSSSFVVTTTTQGPKTDGSFPRLMREGDLVICYERHDSMDHFILQASKIFNNKFGAFYHCDFIGKPFGTRVKSRSSNGWLYALEPIPDLWSLAVHVSSFRLISFGRFNRWSCVLLFRPVLKS
jgi:hypothetical protein